MRRFKGVTLMRSLESRPSVDVFSTMPAQGFSGGRYHALMLCAALSNRGYAVTLFSNNIPRMWDELVASFSGQLELSSLRIRTDAQPITPRRYGRRPDITICVPDINTTSPVFRSAIDHSSMFRSSLVLLNFESPSWFNKTASTARAESLWSGWMKVAKSADVIMSSVDLGSQYAAVDYKVRATTRFGKVSPPINSVAISRVPKQERVRGSIFVATRLTGGGHKGFSTLSKVLPQVKNLRHLIIMVDSPEDAAVVSLRSTLENNNVEVEVKTAIPEREKFVTYARAEVTLFPSTFEGFGYPPIESLAMGTPCAVRDLEVYHETTGSDVIRLPADVDKWPEALDRALAEISEHLAAAEARSHHYRSAYSFEATASMFESEFAEYVHRQPSPGYTSIVRSLAARFSAFIRTSRRPLRRTSRRPLRQIIGRLFWDTKRWVFQKLFGRSTWSP